MDIYEDDKTRGILDLRKARRELEASATVNIAEVRHAIVAEISAAALLDIAYSLRPIGAEAADAMRDRVAYATYDEAESDEPVRDLVVGDHVTAIGSKRAGEIIGLGYDQETRYALVRFSDSGEETRVWTHVLELADEKGDASDEPELRPDAAIVELADGSAPPIVDGLQELTSAELVEGGDLGFNHEELRDEDDLDRDFDTDTSGLAAIVDETPAPTVSPLDALAEKAPAKKKGGKK